VDIDLETTCKKVHPSNEKKKKLNLYSHPQVAAPHGWHPLTPSGDYGELECKPLASS